MLVVLGIVLTSPTDVRVAPRIISDVKLLAHANKSKGPFTPQTTSYIPYRPISYQAI
jgi:hypothetical protein